jgi:uncharacterized protein YbcI
VDTSELARRWQGLGDERARHELCERFLPLARRLAGPAELNLQAMDEHQRLRDIRLFFQYAERSRFTEPVERITGRRVKAFVSGIDTHTDLACELFVLEPDTSRQNGDSCS